MRLDTLCLKKESHIKGETWIHLFIWGRGVAVYIQYQDIYKWNLKYNTVNASTVLNIGYLMVWALLFLMKVHMAMFTRLELMCRHIPSEPPQRSTLFTCLLIFGNIGKQEVSFFIIIFISIIQTR